MLICEVEGSFELAAAYREAMADGMALWGLPAVGVIATNDLQATVRRLVPHLARYRAERGNGRVAARVLAEIDPPVIVVDGPLMLESGVDAAHRLLAHETGHLALKERGEITEAWGVPRDSWQAHLLHAGGNALEEFRIERSLSERGLPAGQMTHVDFMSDTLCAHNIDLVEAIADPRSAEDLNHFIWSVTRPVSDLSKVFGYASAPVLQQIDDAFPIDNLSPSGRTHWDDYVGEHWDARMTFYRTVSGASESLAGDDFDRMADTVLDLECDLLERAGFFVEDRGDTWGFWRITDEPMWRDRVRRGLANADAYGWVGSESSST